MKGINTDLKVNGKILLEREGEEKKKRKGGKEKYF